jgi:hypothetical protein
VLPFHHRRKCVISFPPLWTIVPIGYSTKLDELALWLFPSASAPLHIPFHYRPSDGSLEQIMVHFSTMCKFISNHSPRVRSLAIEGILSLRTLISLRTHFASFVCSGMVLRDHQPHCPSWAAMYPEISVLSTSGARHSAARRYASIPCDSLISCPLPSCDCEKRPQGSS